MTTTKQWGWLNRLTGASPVNFRRSTVNSFSRGYNLANQRTNRTEADDSCCVYHYDSLGQVISGRKYWQGGSPVAGQQFECTFDDIGNRKSAAAGGDQGGGNLHAQNCAANLLNQYTSRTVPGFAGVLGSATNSSTFSLWGSDGSRASTLRHESNFWGEHLSNVPKRGKFYGAIRNWTSQLSIVLLGGDNVFQWFPGTNSP